MIRILLIIITLIFATGCFNTLSIDTLDPTTIDIDPEKLPIKSHPHNNQPLFMCSNPNDYIEVDLYADFEIINDNSIAKDQAKSSGRLEYNDPRTGENVTIDNIKVYARGKSRYEFCKFRPLKIDFGSKQRENIFENASKKIKLVTHCECNSEWENRLGFLPGNDHEQEQRLLMEYYMYKVQETLNSTSLLTRLTRITYHNTSNNPSWSIKTKWAFFREREKVAAKRVNMREMEDNEYPDPADRQIPFPANLVSYFQGCLLDNFMYQSDGGLLYESYAKNGELMYYNHNIVALVNDKQDDRAYFISYDWDLTGVIAPSYWKHTATAKTLKENAKAMKSVLLNCNDQSLAKTQAYALYSHKEEMQEIVRNAEHLDPSNRLRMEEWLEENFIAIEDYLFGSP